MAKNIVICSDGTGNRAIKGRGTNVFKLFEAIDLERPSLDPSCAPQVAIYDDGVGTENFKPLKILAGCDRLRAEPQRKQLYKELCASTIPAIGSSCSASAAARSRSGRSPG